MATSDLCCNGGKKGVHSRFGFSLTQRRILSCTSIFWCSLPQDVLLWSFVENGNVSLWTGALPLSEDGKFIWWVSFSSITRKLRFDDLSPSIFVSRRLTSEPQELYLCNLTQLHISSISVLGIMIRSCSLVLFRTFPRTVHFLTLFCHVFLCRIQYVCL